MVTLGILDHGTVRTGESRAQSLQRVVTHAQIADELGYARYWLGEHHGQAGVSSTSPHVLIPFVLGATQRIRVGSAATVLANYSSTQAAEEATVIAHLAGSRFDFGLARYRYPLENPYADQSLEVPQQESDTQVDGVAIPRAPVQTTPEQEKYLWVQDAILGPLRSEFGSYEQRVREVHDLLHGGYRHSEYAPEALLTPEPEGFQLWIHGQNPHGAGVLAATYGAHLSTRYLVHGHKVRPTIEAYRQRFRPSASLDAPYVTVAANVLVIEPGVDLERELAIEHAASTYNIDIAAPDAAGRRHPDRTSVEKAVAGGYQPAETSSSKVRIIGYRDEVLQKIRALQDFADVDEVIVQITSVDDGRVVHTIEQLSVLLGE